MRGVSFDLYDTRSMGGDCLKSHALKKARLAIAAAILNSKDGDSILQAQVFKSLVVLEPDVLTLD